MPAGPPPSTTTSYSPPIAVCRAGSVRKAMRTSYCGGRCLHPSQRSFTAAHNDWALAERRRGLSILVLGLASFIANHLFVTFREARAAAIRRLGKPLYHSLFGLVSLVGLALIVWGFAQYRATGWVQVWTPPAFMRHVTIGLMLVASILIAAYLIPSHIKARARHPLLAAV